MLSRAFALLVAVLALGGSVSMAAEPPAWPSPTGLYTIKIPPSYKQMTLKSYDNVDVFGVERDGVRIAACTVSVEKTPQRATPASWARRIDRELTSPALAAAGLSSQAGDTFVGLKGTRPYKTGEGFDGYFYWYDRVEKKTGKTRSDFMSSTMLAPDLRLLSSCIFFSSESVTALEATLVRAFVMSARATTKPAPVTFGAADVGRPAASFEEPWTNPIAGATFTLSLHVRPHTNSINARRSQFVISRSGAVPQDVGLCVALVEPLKASTTKEEWAAYISDRVRDPEGRQRALTAADGDTYIRHLGSKPFSSQAGWAGYFYAFDRALAATKQSNSIVSATTLLNDNSRLVLLCRSDPGFSFTPADIDAIFKFARSARRS